MPEPNAKPHPLSAAMFLVAAVACLTPWVSGPIALAAGIALALAGITPFPALAKRISKFLVQTCVVLLGLRLDLSQLAQAALDGVALAVTTIAGTFALGWLLGQALRTRGELGLLVNSGTAICGASAIAAVGTSVAALPASIAVATGAIFVLNAVGLFVLPVIGHSLNLSEVQFGTWAGVALHDVASVAAAAADYRVGPEPSSIALDTANVVKMTRVLWILPIALIARRVLMPTADRKVAAPFPWFILLFVAASGLRSLIPQLAGYEPSIKAVASSGFQLALFLIGSGLSRAVLRSVGWRVFAHATILWIAVAAGSLGIIRAM